MHIHIEFTLTAYDYAEFNRGFLKNRKLLFPSNQRGLRSPNILFIAAFVLLFVGMGIIRSFLSIPPSPPPAPSPYSSAGEAFLAAVPIFMFFFMFLVTFFSIIFFLPKSKYFRHQFAASYARIDQSISADIFADHIVIREPTSSTDSQWCYYIRIIETPNTFLLFFAPRLAHIMPKRAFTNPQDLESFRQLASANIGSQPIGFPVQPPATAATPPQTPIQ